MHEIKATEYTHRSADYRQRRHTADLLLRFLFAVVLLALPVFLMAQGSVKWNQRYQNYIDTYRDVAIYEMMKHGIPASITMAQGILESGAGESDLARKGNNHFGIKCHDWRGPSMKRDDDELGECFRVYASPFESFEDHSEFLKRPRYQRLFSLRQTDYVGWANGLKACGYATNPRYAQLLIDIIRRYNLDALDRETKYDEAALQRMASGVYTPTSSKGYFTAGGHSVKMCNRNYYVVARNGDTFRSIAKEFDVSYRKLAKYNERDKDDALRAGDIIYLEKKRTKADKSFKHRPHIVMPGESMYSIAQNYGVRLKSLYKKNGLSLDHTIRVGDRIKVY